MKPGRRSGVPAAELLSRERGERADGRVKKSYSRLRSFPSKALGHAHNHPEHHDEGGKGNPCKHAP